MNLAHFLCSCMLNTLNICIPMTGKKSNFCYTIAIIDMTSIDKPAIQFYDGYIYQIIGWYKRKFRQF
jgi:hypothetical protein